MPAFAAVVVFTTVTPGSGCSGCDDIGCPDQVVFIEAGELPTSLLPFDITACVDGICHEIPYIVTEQNSPMVPVSVEVPTTGVKDGDALAVTLSVSSHANGEVLLESSGNAEAVGSRHCGKPCTQALLTLDPASGLLVKPALPD